MKQILSKTLIFGTFGLATLSATGGCSSDPTVPPPLPSGNSAGTTSTGGTAGAATTGGTAGAATTGGTAGVGGTYVAGGTAGSGTGGGGTGGGGTGGGGTGGTGGGGTGGTGGAGKGGTGGTGGAVGVTDFPQDCPDPAATHSATAATSSCWSLVASECINVADNPGLQNLPDQAVDGNMLTRFSTGALMTTSQAFDIVVDLGSAIEIDGVSVSSMVDFAPGIQVGVSTDNVTFDPVACANGAAITNIPFAPVSARYVKLTQHGIKAAAWWSIYELSIYHTGTDSCGGGGTVMSECTVLHTAI